MSSIHAPAARNGASAHGHDPSEIIHFDATLRRKEKMRSRAEQAPPPASEPAGALLHPSARPANGRTNGSHPAKNGTHAAPAARTLTAEVAPPPAATAAASSEPDNAAEPARTSAAVTVPASRMTGGELERFLIAFVVEQTGYPEEMVELDADLEADLGIDSIKKAQLFGELAEQFDIQAADASDLSLDDFPTLRQVMAFLENSAGGPDAVENMCVESPESRVESQERVEGRGSSVESQPVAQPAYTAAASIDSKPAPVNSAGLSGAELETFLISFVVEQTGYPEEMVELDADLEADLGIDSIKKAQLFGELAEHFEIRTADATELSLDDFPTLRHVLQFLAGAAAQGPSPNDAAPAAGRNGSVQHAASAAAPVFSQSAADQSPVSFDREPQVAFSAEYESVDSADSAVMSSEELEHFLVGFVVEQTGYPEDMVELDADLEADLGIDSIKKAQLFGELAEQFEIQTSDVSELSLDDFPTLRHVMNFLAGAPRRMTV